MSRDRESVAFPTRRRNRRRPGAASGGGVVDGILQGVMDFSENKHGGETRGVILVMIASTMSALPAGALPASACGGDCMD